MSQTIERLYDLLPRVYRKWDDKSDSLRAFMAILESQYQVLEKDISGLYNDWFIETCSPDCIPYIADLVGVRGLTEANRFPGSWRALTANTIAFRRRKGTVAVITYAVRDAAALPALAVECFQHIAVNQSMKDIRLNRGKTVNIKHQHCLNAVNSPFNVEAHTVDLRGFPIVNEKPVPTLQNRGAGFNLPNIGIFLWRLEAYPVIEGDARPVNGGGYRFNPLDVDMQLFNLPQTQPLQRLEPSEVNLPVPLTLKSGLFIEKGENRERFPVFQIYVKPFDQESYQTIMPEVVAIADLSHWQLPIVAKNKAQVVVDPQLGRLKFMPGFEPEKVKVSYSYGFSADVGGGPYLRFPEDTLRKALTAPWIGVVSSTAEKVLQNRRLEKNIFLYDDLKSALQGWRENGGKGIISFMNNSTFHLSDCVSHEPEGPLQPNGDGSDGFFWLTIAGNQWLNLEASDGFSPCIIGNLGVKGENSNAALTMDGLWMDGQVRLSGSVNYKLNHCTLRPVVGRASLLTFQEDCNEITVKINDSISGALQLPANLESLEIRGSIIDGCSDYAIAGTGGLLELSSGPSTVIEKSTVLGPSAFLQLTSASDVLFAGKVMVTNVNNGFIRYSYVPEGSLVPVLYQCTDDDGQTGMIFTTVHFGRPGYGQLGPGCTQQIKTGAENGAEMGAFNRLFQPQRLANIMSALDEYFPVGMKPGLFYVT